MVEYTGSSGIWAVPDIEAARTFYADVLGLDVSEEMGMLQLRLPGGATAVVYPKDDHAPAVFTILNLMVRDLPAAVDELVGRGARMERYDGFEHDDRGIVGGFEEGPDIAWTTDPAGNIIALIAE